MKDAKIAQIKAAIELERWRMDKEKIFYGVVRLCAEVVGFLMSLMRDSKKIIQDFAVGRRQSNLESNRYCYGNC